MKGSTGWAGRQKRRPRRVSLRHQGSLGSRGPRPSARPALGLHGEDRALSREYDLHGFRFGALYGSPVCFGDHRQNNQFSCVYTYYLYSALTSVNPSSVRTTHETKTYNYTEPSQVPVREMEWESHWTLAPISSITSAKCTSPCSCVAVCVKSVGNRIAQNRNQ